MSAHARSQQFALEGILLVVDEELPLHARLQNYPVLLGPEDGPYACPYCGYITLSERGAFEICPVCFWEDDGQDDPDADVVLGGPNRRLSLTQARQNFALLGACDERSRSLSGRHSLGSVQAPERESPAPIAE